MSALEKLTEPNLTMRKRVVSLDVSVIGYQQAIVQVIELGEAHISSYACFSNVHMTIEAKNSPEFQEMVNKATFTFPDGMPLVFALRMLYGIKQDRIAGMDFMQDILRAGNNRQTSIFLFGSTPEILDGLKSYLNKNFPLIKLVGALSPPFRTLSEKENTDIVDEINSSKANLVFVGLGCPKQEIWMAKNSANITATLLGVGGAFEIYAGKAKRSPNWMQRMGLEWLYRLGQEPRRLFKRYTITNTRFIYFLTKDFFLQLKVKALNENSI